MFTRIALRVVITMCVLVYAGTALAQGKVQNYFNDAACKVKATSDPSQKREILNNSFDNMSKALDTVRNSALVSTTDRAGIDRVTAALQEKQDELAGTNGFTRVPDAQLNAFSDYVVQDMEQADQVVTISLVVLLLIIILVVLLV